MTARVAAAEGAGTAATPPCARCARHLGRSCCEVDDGEQLATLTRADAERLQAALGRAPARFTEVEVLGHEEAHAYEARRPLYRGYFRHGPFRLTLQRKEGACVFFERGRGCALSAVLRPTACRLYPFELWPDGTWSLQVERHGSLVSAGQAGPGGACLAVEEAESMDALLPSLGTSRAEVEALGERLREEVLGHARAGGALPLDSGR